MANIFDDLKEHKENYTYGRVPFAMDKMRKHSEELVEHGGAAAAAAAGSVVLGLVASVAPANPAAAAEVVSRSANETIVKLEPGDTMSALSREHGASVEDMAEVNRIADPDIIYAGDQLKIPHKPPEAPPVHAHAKMKKGDTVWGIAEQVTEATPDPNDETADRTKQLLRVNDVEDPRRMPVGTGLVIPGVTQDLVDRALNPAHDAKTPAEQPKQPEQTRPITLSKVQSPAPPPPKPAAQTPETAPAPAAKVNYNAIKKINGVKPELIQRTVRYMIERHGLTPLGAAYLTGNFIQESGLKPNAVGDNGTAIGIAQWSGDRRADVPEGDLFGQIDFAIKTEMDRDGRAADLDGLLRDPKATKEQLCDAIERWERWSKEGKRFEYAKEIYAALMTPVPGNPPAKAPPANMAGQTVKAAAEPAQPAEPERSSGSSSEDQVSQTAANEATTTTADMQLVPVVESEPADEEPSDGVEPAPPAETGPEGESAVAKTSSAAELPSPATRDPQPEDESPPDVQADRTHPHGEPPGQVGKDRSSLNPSPAPDAAEDQPEVAAASAEAEPAPVPPAPQPAAPQSPPPAPAAEPAPPPKPRPPQPAAGESKKPEMRNGNEIKKELKRKYGEVSGKLNKNELERLGDAWGGHKLYPDAAKAFREMNEAYRTRFGENIELTSSYRDYQGQKATKRKRGKYAAKPGRSNHGWGLAVDVKGGANREGNPRHEWLEMHAHKFGFVNPGWAHDGRGIEEPWHFEWLGSAATYAENN